MDMIGWGAGIEAGDPDHLIIYVSGYIYPGYKEFHFKKFADRFNQTKLFLRDDSGHQFRQGIPEVTNSEEENVEFLRYMISRVGASRVTIVSGSVGTHPSVLWGHWIGVDDIYLVGPVSNLVTMIHTDRANHQQFMGLTIEAAKVIEQGYEYADLRPFMQANSDKVASIDIYYGQMDQIDMEQSGNIADLPQVRSTVYYSGDHFRVPAYALRRDPDIEERINAQVIEKPVEMRQNGNTAPVDLGYAAVRLD